jgi:hypothetical protein
MARAGRKAVASASLFSCWEASGWVGKVACATVPQTARVIYLALEGGFQK